MAKHYYNIEFVTTSPLGEDEVQDLEELLKRFAGDWSKITVEYVDSEG